MPENQDNDKTRTHFALTKGTMVSHYRIIEKIGAGGMGEVYLAEDAKLKRQVALKFLPPHLCQDEDLRVCFEREAKAISSLNHPNICTLHDVGHHEGTDFLIMEYLEGEVLSERLKRSAKDQVFLYYNLCCM